MGRWVGGSAEGKLLSREVDREGLYSRDCVVQ